MLDIRCKYLQLIVILLPICQLSVQVQSPSPGYCGGSKAVVRCGPGPLQWSHWPLVPTLGHRRQYLERASAVCVCILLFATFLAKISPLISTFQLISPPIYIIFPACTHKISFLI